MFNLVNQNSNDKWESDKSYLYKEDDNIHYYFDSVHEKMMTEKFVSDDIIQEKIKKNWNITMKVTPVGDNLDSKYTWYVLKHN